jgi:hypothetical protein
VTVDRIPWWSWRWLRYLWRTRAVRWKAWIDPHNPEPWSPEEVDIMARAASEVMGIDP